MPTEPLPNPSREANESFLRNEDAEASQLRGAEDLQRKQSTNNSPLMSLRVNLGDSHRHCEEHGAYTATGYRLSKVQFWSRCPTCKEIEDTAKQQEEEARHRQHVAERRDAAARAAGIQKRFRGCGFYNYEADTDDKAKALNCARIYANDFQDALLSGAGLVLAGPPGTGKTHLAASVLLHLIDHRRLALRYISCADLVGAIRSTWSKNATKTETQVLAEFGEHLDLLVIDEMGVQAGTENEQALLFRVLDARYAEQRPTILITNLNRSGLKEFVGDRIFDRLRETHQWVTFAWPSHRPAARQEAA